VVVIFPPLGGASRMAGPTEIQILLLGAFAGLTIFLGMPIARSPRFSDIARVGLSAFAAGILIYLFVDVLHNARETILAPLNGSPSDGPATITLAAVLVLGFPASMGALLLSETLWTRRAGVGRSDTVSLDPLDL